MKHLEKTLGNQTQSMNVSQRFEGVLVLEGLDHAHQAKASTMNEAIQGMPPHCRSFSGHISGIIRGLFTVTGFGWLA